MPHDIRIRFGRAIRPIREEQEITQEEAADQCNLHRTYYSGIERGIRNVSLVNIEQAESLRPPLQICSLTGIYISLKTRGGLGAEPTGGAPRSCPS